MANQPGGRSPKPTEGPQFGLDYESGRGKRFKGWINRYGSSVILPIIALLILAGGIYLYANQGGETLTSLDENSASISEGIILSPDGEPIIGGETIQETPVDQKDEIKEIIPESRKEGGEFVEKAIRGEGVTHLARRALKNYLEDNPQELTNEYKIYIEDYLKDNIGSRPLEVGEEIAFSQDLIKEAIDASSTLSPEQLKILEEYSALVAW